MSDWIYSINGQTKGPVSEGKILDLVLKQELEINDYVANPTDNIWKKIKDIPALMDKIQSPELAIHHDHHFDSAFQEFIDGEDASHNVYFYVSMPRLIKMTILSMGFYLAYWWYKNWYYWMSKKGQRQKSPDREFGYFLAPLFLLDKIQLDPELNKVERSDFNGRSLLVSLFMYSIVLYVISLLVGSKGVFSGLIYVLGTIGSIMFFMPVQSYINRVNDKLHNKYEKPGIGHYACIVIGIFSWATEIITAVVKLTGIV